ncbi:MAG: hypothetical protein Q7T86_16800 [Hyphomicrobiaceae bacterium]|nr:hypothetical protein [Hyphomicrobiaceae bacterium]
MRTDLSGLKFIIVAGTDLASNDLSESLARRGAQVVIAPDCAAAFEAMEQTRPDFAVLDWSLDCDAVAAELNSLDIPHLYVGTPAKRDRDTVRNHFSAAFADAMLTMVNNDESSVFPTSPDYQLNVR